MSRPSSAAGAASAPGWLAGLSPRRVGLAALLGSLVAVALNPVFITPFVELWSRTLILALLLTLAYTLAGNWRQRRLPAWLVQVAAVALAAPLATFGLYLFTVRGDLAALLGNEHRLAGFAWLSGTAVVVGLMLALVAMVREREAQAQAQALQFELERATLERQASDARLKLLQAQIEPHFLFNTLANVQALVETGSAQAAPVLASLIAYLRAAMPKLREHSATLGDELALVRAYLELMHLRMPDRLRYSVAVPAELHALRFPAMALLTLVENAVRHGIDPAEQGGSIDIELRPEGGWLRLSVTDSGVGLDPNAVPGTGLANLRQRLAAFYGPAARLDLLAGSGGRGLRAELRLPADGAAS